jgi:hypothetical protein
MRFLPMKTSHPTSWLVFDRAALTSIQRPRNNSLADRIETFSSAPSPRDASSSRMTSPSAGLRSRLYIVRRHHYLRPGHISAAFVLAVVDALLESTVDVQPPFVVVAERRQTAVRVRVRTEPPW